MRSFFLLVLIVLASQITIAQEQVPGCPTYLQKSLVTWNKKSDGNIWEVRNATNIGVAVIYIKPPGNWIAHLNPGQSEEVSDISEEPPYVVLNLKEVSELEGRDRKKYVECSPGNEFILRNSIDTSAGTQSASGQMPSGATRDVTSRRNVNSVKKNTATSNVQPCGDSIELQVLTLKHVGRGKIMAYDKNLGQSFEWVSLESGIEGSEGGNRTDPESRRLNKWLRCVQTTLNSSDKESGGVQGKSNDSDIDTVTPQVPGCPRYLSKSNVKWERKPGSNPQFNVWEVRNASKRILKVTYVKDGSNNDTRTLNPGDAVEVWGLSKEPPYVVRDFNELGELNSAHNATKALQTKSLQCELAIRPR